MKFGKNFQFGFTLLELTIGMTLLALMTMILYAAFDVGQRAMEKSQARVEESQRRRSVEEMVAGYVRSAYPYRSSSNEPALLFSGDENGLTFVSALSLGMGGRGMASVTLYWEGKENGSGRLILEEKIPVRREEPVDGEGHHHRAVLGEAVKGFRIDYLESQPENDEWVTRWDGKEKKTLPRAIRLSQRGEDGREILWVFPVMMRVLTP